MFACAGYMVKKWPWSDGYFIDSGWDEADDAVDDLLQSNSVVRNEMGLFEFVDECSYRGFLGRVRGDSSINVVAVGVGDVIYEHMKSLGRIGFGCAVFNELDYSLIGYDLIDVHGLFTCLNHPLLMGLRGSDKLFLPCEVDLARTYQELASYAAPEHSPYILAAVFLLKPVGG